MLDDWYLKMWGFYEGSSLGKGYARVERRTLTQDYREGGQRCLDIETFARSLYVKQVNRLLL